MMKSFLVPAMFILTLFGLPGGSALAEERDPQTLKLGSWVCDSPQSYDAAVTAQRAGDKQLWDLRKELENNCLYMDDDNLEDMLAPYVTVLEQQGDKVKVSFFVVFYKRIAMLHRKIDHVKFIGWTDAGNVKSLYN